MQATSAARANVITDPLELRTYECDGLSHLAPVRARAGGAAVVRPTEVAAVVAECARAGVPFVARGSGTTGLSGGALPHEQWRAGRDVPDACHCRDRPGERRAVVEPGVTNLAVEQGRGDVRPVLPRPTRRARWCAQWRQTWRRDLRRGALPLKNGFQPCTTSPAWRSSRRPAS